MFKIDLSENRIAPVAKKSFTELKLRERDHLQEWIAKSPDALGEDLLIIQKEFSGFDGTQERLDLLALDTSGRLVVIENKLDDSGRDVIWQALKYAAYCSTLRTDQIVDIYQTHLGAGAREEAREQIADFLSEGDSEEVSLNPTGSQRIILVAANFRREVTSTVLWLLNKGVEISCFEVAPYQTGDELFLDVSQIIPTPQTADYMIRLAEKTASEDKLASAGVERHARLRAYWTQLIDAADKQGVAALSGRSPSKENWMDLKAGIRGAHFVLSILADRAEIKLYFQLPEKNLTKALFDFTKENSTQIQTEVAGELDWRRMDDFKSSQVVLSKSFDGLDREEWPKMISWHLGKLAAFDKALEPLKPKLTELARSS